MMVIDVTRKGGKRDSVNVASFAKPYLETYLSIRDKRYKAEKQDVALFLTEYRGVPNRIDASSIEKWLPNILRISKFVYPHKLRHTLATRLYDATKSQVLVSHQLGHASTQVTDLYTHIVNDDKKCSRQFIIGYPNHSYLEWLFFFYINLIMLKSFYYSF
ncbi:MAG: tyrosine-type recombinase/integrase [Streptococcus salivarius]